MKKVAVMLICLLAVLAAACNSTSKARTTVQDPNTPEWLNDFPPEDVLWGIGTAKQSSEAMSMTMAESRARQNIAFQLNTEVQAMITDYARDAGTTDNQASLQLAETVGRQLTQTTLSGVSPLKRWKASDGTWWYLVQLKKADAAQAAAGIIDSEAARYAEFKSMEALKMMDAQLAKKNDKPVPVTE
jgi:cbb3-type cytochrome oxidase subunit 3